MLFLACQRGFYRPQHNENWGTHRIDFLRSWNGKLYQQVELKE